MNLSSSWPYLERLARDRLRNNRTRRHEKGDRLEILGAAGELAARRYLGLPEELHNEFDGGVDLNWRGWSVDVKATRFTPLIQHRYLQWPHWKYIKSDIVLMVGVNLDEKWAAVLGWTRKENILQAPINKGRKIPCHEIPVTDLNNAWELYALKEKKNSRS